MKMGEWGYGFRYLGRRFESGFAAVEPIEDSDRGIAFQSRFVATGCSQRRRVLDFLLGAETDFGCGLPRREVSVPMVCSSAEEPCALPPLEMLGNECGILTTVAQAV